MTLLKGIKLLPVDSASWGWRGVGGGVRVDTGPEETGGVVLLFLFRLSNLCTGNQIQTVPWFSGTDSVQ